MKQGTQDAFGAAALAFVSGNIHVEILLPSDSDTLGDELDKEPMSNYFQKYEQFDDEIKAILPFATGRTLDIGCGAGRFSLYLQEDQKLEVVGIDESWGAVEACRRRGLRDVRWVDVETLDVSEVGFFDSFLLLGHNIGIGGTPEGVRELLDRLSLLGRGKARLLVNSIDVLSVKEEWSRRGVKHSLEIERPPGQRRYSVRYGECDTGWFDWIHLSPRELEDLATREGWRLKLVVQRNDKPGYWSGMLERGD